MWYVLSIHSSKHRKIDEKLKELGVRRFYPMRTVWRKQRVGPRKRIDTPLFPAYLFVGLSFKSTSARSILSIDGVRCFLGVDHVPQRIRDPVIKRIRDAVGAGDYDETSRIIAQALVGTSMTIQEGPFAGYGGTISAVAGRTASVDVSIFGRTTAVKINIDKLA